MFRHMAALALLASPVVADDLDQRKALAAVLVQSPTYAQVIDRVISQDAIMAQLAAAAGRLTPDEMEALRAAAGTEAERSRPEVEAIFAASAARTFTLAELQAMETAFGDPAIASAFAKAAAFNGIAGRQLSLYMQELRRRVVRSGAKASGDN